MASWFPNQCPYCKFYKYGDTLADSKCNQSGSEKSFSGIGAMNGHIYCPYYKRKGDTDED